MGLTVIAFMIIIIVPMILIIVPMIIIIVVMPTMLFTERGELNVPVGILRGEDCSQKGSGDYSLKMEVVMTVTSEIDILVSKLLGFETFAKSLRVSVSENLVSEKKSRFRSRKNLVSEKSLGF